MADNFTFTEGSGKTMAALEDSSVLHQKVVLEHTGASTTPLTTSNTNPIPVVKRPLAAGNGLTLHHLKAAGSTNATSVKASAGSVYCINAINTNSADRFLKLYNKASAPTVGSDTPVAVFPLPENVPLNLNLAGFGIAFTTGIAYAITTGVADSDTGAVTANDVLLNLLYI